LLKLRTALLGVIGFLLLAMAAVMLLGVMPSAIDAFASVLIGVGPVHVPENLFADLSNTSRMPLISQLSFLAVAGLGVSAMSRYSMSALHCKLWLVLLVGLGRGCFARPSYAGRQSSVAQPIAICTRKKGLGSSFQALAF